MRPKSLTRRIDSQHRLTLPKNMLDKLFGNFDENNENNSVEVRCQGDRIIVTRDTPYCVFCYSEEDLIGLRDKSICRNCLNELIKQTGKSE